MGNNAHIEPKMLDKSTTAYSLWLYAEGCGFMQKAVAVDGQSSGHDYYGTLWMPPTGFVNNCDGGRSHSYCDYRQQ